MQANERIEKFLALQNKNIKFDDISKELGVASKTLRSFLNKKGYKMEEGIYKLKEEAKEANQIAFTEIKEKALKSTTKKAKTTENTKTTKKEVVKEIKPKAKATNTSKSKATTKAASKEKTTTTIASKVKSTTNTVSKAKPKKDRKINVTQEDLDKLCEVYDWYLEVKDNKTFKPKKASNKKDVVLDEAKIDDLKSTTIRLDKSTWEDFERLCSNSEHSKQEIITQALKDFMKEYKYLL